RKIPPNELAHFLRAQIIGVVITGTENVSAENNSPFHFRAESFRTRAGVMIKQTAHFLRTMSVAHAIKAREIGRGLCRRQNIVNADGVVRMRKRDLDDLGTEFA